MVVINQEYSEHSVELSIQERENNLMFKIMTSLSEGGETGRFIILNNNEIDQVIDYLLAYKEKQLESFNKCDFCTTPCGNDHCATR